MALKDIKPLMALGFSTEIQGLK